MNYRCVSHLRMRAVRLSTSYRQGAGRATMLTRIHGQRSRCIHEGLPRPQGKVADTRDKRSRGPTGASVGQGSLCNRIEIACPLCSRCHLRLKGLWRVISDSVTGWARGGLGDPWPAHVQRARDSCKLKAVTASPVFSFLLFSLHSKQSSHSSRALCIHSSQRVDRYNRH